jgi:hypothetical protein
MSVAYLRHAHEKLPNIWEKYMMVDSLVLAHMSEHMHLWSEVTENQANEVYTGPSR